MLIVEMLQAALLGMVQGLTEFLPISSSGHLLVFPWLLGWTAPLLNSLVFDAALHLGTLCSALVYFRHEWWAIARSFTAFAPERRVEVAANRRLALLLVLGAVPAGIAGLLMDEIAETLFRHPLLTALMLVTVGVLMWVAELHHHADGPTRTSLHSLRVQDTLVVGIAQIAAFVPGVSRSGITIVAGLASGLNRETAARFSFLLGTPVIAGAGVLKTMQLLRADLDPAQLGTFLVGMATAFFLGYGAIAFLLAYVRQRPLYIFVLYRFALAGLIIAGWFLGRPWPWPPS